MWNGSLKFVNRQRDRKAAVTNNAVQYMSSSTEKNIRWEQTYLCLWDRTSHLICEKKCNVPRRETEIQHRHLIVYWMQSDVGLTLSSVQSPALNRFSPKYSGSTPLPVFLSLLHTQSRVSSLFWSPCPHVSSPFVCPTAFVLKHSQCLFFPKIRSEFRAHTKQQVQLQFRRCIVYSHGFRVVHE